MVHSSSMRYAAVAVTITAIAFALVAVELFIIIPTAVVAFTPPSRTSAFRSSIIHADDVSTCLSRRLLCSSSKVAIARF